MTCLIIPQDISSGDAFQANNITRVIFSKILPSMPFGITYPSKTKSLHSNPLWGHTAASIIASSYECFACRLKDIVYLAQTFHLLGVPGKYLATGFPPVSVYLAISHSCEMELSCTWPPARLFCLGVFR
ncbi:hypothetical protein CDAR_583121 [Caerostris darwini]|uniref:Uncharacterized protein n=1 Tax=Caerostris darwini TaxID=1538125 RepID=A0AAV4P869_9ARAC|nr:hypothetical protein CDAR_583121 [Caerostris darwini]